MSARSDDPPKALNGPFGKNRALLRFLRLANLVVFVAALFLVGRFVLNEWAKIDLKTFGPNLGLLGAAFCLTLVYLALYALGWWLILRSAGSRVEIGASSAIWALSGFGKYVPGKIATLAYRTLMFGATGSTSAQQIILGWTVESITTVFGGLVALALAMALVGVNELVGGLQLRDILIVGALTLAGAAVGLSRPVRTVVFKRVGLTSAVDNMKTSTFIGMTFFYGACWWVLGAVFWIVTWAFGVAGLDLRYATLVCTSAGIAGMLSVLTPSGLGVREGAMILMLSTFMSEGHAAAVALSARLISTAGDGAAVAIGYVMVKALRIERPTSAAGTASVDER